MSYCTLADVQKLIVNIQITANSKVTQDTVENEIFPEMDRYIDDRLGRYYQTPISGVNALLTVNRISKYLVAAEVMDRVYSGQTPSDSPQGQNWRKLAEVDITRIINGDIILTDAVPTGETPEPEVDRIGDLLSQQPDIVPPRRFSMGKVF